MRPPQRLSRALPDEPTATTRAEPEPEPITTARRPPAEATTSDPAPAPEMAAGGTGRSVMREWVNELTGRTERASTGIRVPSEAEISQVMSMFPDVQRDVVVGALQRRSVQCCHTRYSGHRLIVSRFCSFISSNTEGAVETLLHAA